MDQPIDTSYDESQSNMEAPTDPAFLTLRKSNALERRASKRYSSFNLASMLPSGSDHIGSPQRPTRRAERPPPMPPLPEGLGSLRSESSPEPTVSALLGPPRIITNGNDATSNSGTNNERPSTPDPEDIHQQSTPRPPEHQRQSKPLAVPTDIQVFMQIGKQVKKVSVDLPATLSALRLLFMEKFEYDPGMEDFPDVYIRDHRTGMQFELEDMAELKEGSVLNLNIERELSVIQTVCYTVEDWLLTGIP